MKKFLTLIVSCILLLGSFSCGNKSKIEMTPEQKEYTQFQLDSLKKCTDNERTVKAAVMGAFDRVPENNGYWKRDKVTVNYNDSLQCWIGVVDYHYDRNNTYFQASKTFHVRYWAEQNGPNAEVFYTITEAK